MGSLLDALAFEVVMIGLLFHFLWVLVMRSAREKYLHDLKLLRPPSSRLARYYSWRIASKTNIVIEAATFLVMMTSCIVGIMQLVVGYERMVEAFHVVLLVLAISCLTVIQNIRQVADVATGESELLAEIEGGDTQDGVVRGLLESLGNMTASDKKRVLFILFRLAMTDSRAGRVIRDALREAMHQPMIDWDNQ